jgi:hypothetical protein
LLQHMSQVQWRVGIGQCRSHQYLSWGASHGDRGRQQERREVYRIFREFAVSK